MLQSAWRSIVVVGAAVTIAVGGWAAAAAGAVKPHVVGGTLAAQGEFPWMVRISESGCGGALISDQIVLTAAHCVSGTGPTTGYTLTLGAVDLQDPNRITRQSIYVYQAPGFSSSSHDQDWALIKMNSPVSTITPLGVTTSTSYDTASFSSGLFTIAGWGATVSGGSQQQYLRKAQLPPVADSTCQQTYTDLVPSDMICAGYTQGGVDACQGDSGGPMVTRDYASQWIEVGIVSFGIGCALPNTPGVYTQVSTYGSTILYEAGVLANPLTLNLSGPGSIPSKGTYTYSANQTGFVNPSYDWSERFCTDATEASCGTWQDMTFPGPYPTYNRVLSHNCSGTGLANYQVSVMVVNTDGRSLQQQMTSQLCQSVLN